MASNLSLQHGSLETLSFEGVYVSCSTHGKPGDEPQNPGSPICAGIRHNPKWNAVTGMLANAVECAARGRAQNPVGSR
jgi:hypothetical protein